MADRRNRPAKARKPAPASAPSKSTSRNARPPLAVFTVGHSTRPIQEFIALLRAHGVCQLADVRTIPRSLHNPQFAQDQLAPALELAGIRYVHLPDLGGLRRAHRDSVNGAWRNASFRGYADYMQTPAFATAIGSLIDRAREQPTAIMCAEAVPWRCHRSLIADALLARGVQVEEIVSARRRQPHKLTPWARVDGQSVTYPASIGVEDDQNRSQ
jgi:uncharacterized protein (DUF488 family)